MSRRRAVFVLTAAGVAMTGLAGLATNVASEKRHWPGPLELLRMHPWWGLLAFAAAAAALFGLAAILPQGSSAAPTTRDRTLADAADRLAASLRRQWSYEAAQRQLNELMMPVRWRSADQDLVVSWPSLARLASTGPGWPRPEPHNWAETPSQLAGNANELVDVLARVPTRRLVVLGEPGAGKTALLVRLLLDLLSRRRPGEAAPILFPLASWDPVNDDLNRWIEYRLITDYPGLAAPSPDNSRESTASALIAAGLIMPVLDGLDEMHDELRTAAIARINDALQPGQRLVVAARTEAFRRAVRPPDGIQIQLVGTAGVELCPLEADVVADYLKESAGGPDSAARWDEIISTFATDRQSPVAQAFATPLMVALARTVYNPRPGENLSAIPNQPIELMNGTLFPTRLAVERHLFDAFIPAAYRARPGRLPRNSWTADQAMRWLTFLAQDLERRQRGTTDIAWWRISGAAPRPLAGFAVGIIAGIGGALGLPFPGLGVGFLAAMLVTLSVRRRIRVGRLTLVGGLAGGIVGGQLAALVALLSFGPGPGNTRLGAFLAGGVAVAIAVAASGRFLPAAAGAFTGQIVASFYEQTAALADLRAAVGSGSYVLNGMGLGLAAGLAAGLFNRRTPARGLRWSWLGFVIGVGGGVLIGFVTWVQAGWTGGLIAGGLATIVSGIAGGLFEAAAPTDLTKAASPAAVLERDRTTFLISLALALPVGLCFAVASALSIDPSTGLAYGFTYGAKIGVANLVAIGLGFSFTQALWGGFHLSSWWLAATRRLPFRLTKFLTDAHINRGVLRQVGAFYQFRHAELQRRIGNPPPTFIATVRSPRSSNAEHSPETSGLR